MKTSTILFLCLALASVSGQDHSADLPTIKDLYCLGWQDEAGFLCKDHPFTGWVRYETADGAYAEIIPTIAIKQPSTTLKCAVTTQVKPDDCCGLRHGGTMERKRRNHRRKVW